MLKGKLPTLNWPVASVVALRSSLLSALERRTVAPGITAPLGSVTVPCTRAALPPCALTPATGHSRKSAESMLEYVPRLNGMESLRTLDE